MGNKWTKGWNGLLTIGIPIFLGLIILFIIIIVVRTKIDSTSGIGTGGDNTEPTDPSLEPNPS